MSTPTYFKNIKRIAIVALPDTRKEFIEWSYANKNILKDHLIISTARTASILEGTLNVPVMNLDHGKAGGYQQLKSLIEQDKTDIVIFFGNPLLHDDRDELIDELVNTAIRHNAVVAYNPATISMILTSIAALNEQHEKKPHDELFVRFIHEQIEKENSK
jgi:methylglyoxal synthase